MATDEQGRVRRLWDVRLNRRTNRRARCNLLPWNEKQPAAINCDGLFYSLVGAKGFEPSTP